jgi:hypothetical protein
MSKLEPMNKIAIVLWQVVLFVALPSAAQDSLPGGQHCALEFDGSDPGPPLEGVAIDDETADRTNGSESRRRIRIELKGPEKPISGEEVEITFKARGSVIEEKSAPSDDANTAAWKYSTTLSQTDWIIVKVLCRMGSDGQLRIVGGDSDHDGTTDGPFEGHRIRVDLKAKPTEAKGIVAEALARWGDYSADAGWMLRCKDDTDEGEKAGAPNP